MKPASRIVTAEEFLHMPEDGMRLELVRGQIKEMSPSGWDHGRVTGRLHSILGMYILQSGLGEVFAAETGFLTERNPDTVRAPDCAFVRKERIPRSPVEAFLPFAPDLAVETVSPGDTGREVLEKVQGWLQAGSRLVWVVDPGDRRVTVHRPGEEPQILAGEDILRGEDVVPGFSMEISRIFS